MGIPLRIRKRIHALRRAPDGSAFQKCDFCGISVAIALFDMHECEAKHRKKRSKGADSKPCVESLNFSDQPRSPFCIFMESFKKIYKNDDLIEIDQRGFQKWKNMLEGERHPFAFEAKKVNSAYYAIMLKEINDTSEEDDEADSVMVGKFDWDYEVYKDRGYNKTFESFDTYELDLLRSWI